MELLVCDMCGTMVNYENAESSWGELAIILGVRDKTKKLYDEWEENPDYSYLKFTNDVVGILVENGLRKEHIRELKQNSKIKDDLDDLVEFSDGNSMEKIIITGGIGNVAELVMSEYGFDECYSSCTFRFDESGDVSSYTLQKCGSSESKLKALKEHIKNKDLHIDEVVFIGDDHNDNHLAEKVEDSFNVGHKDLNSTYDVESLKDIPNYL